ncbi:MAG: hypothetical protein WDM88_11220 [Galbitalea sp.]
MRTRERRSSARRGFFVFRSRAVVAAAASLLLFAGVLAPSSAVAGDPPEVPVIHLDESVSPAPPTALHPGDIATFTYNVECSSLTTECDNFAVTDTIPAPLVLGTVSAPTGVHSTITKSGNTFTVTFIQPLQDGQNGLDAGAQAGFTVTATVPSSVSATYDGQTVANPSTASATNVPTPATATASVLFAVPTQRAATITKSFTPSTVNSTPNLTSTIALAVTNTSNIGASTMTVQEPADVTVSPSPFQYLAITGLTGSTFPGGANRVEVDWYDGTIWTPGSVGTTIALPSGVDPSTIQGLRFVFSKSSGGTIAAGTTGTVKIATALRGNVTSITSDTTVHDIASNFVTVGGINSTTVQGTADLTIKHVSIDPVATKSYAHASIVGGQTDEATVGGSNSGNYTLTKMIVTEPAAGDPTLADQGLGFLGWDNANIEWPVGATGGSIQYLYAGTDPGLGTAQTATRATMPAPAPELGQTVVGFTVTFTGTMPPGQYTTLPFTVSTPAVSADSTVTNTIAYDVTTSDGQTAESLASAGLTLRTARINTSVSKTITPDTIYAVAGASTIISLPAEVSAEPTSPADTGGSTIGADDLTVQDTADPSTDPFWDDFNPAAIVATDVPSSVSLTVNYWDPTSSSWLELDPSTTNVVGPTALSYVLTPAEQLEADGLQFVYTPVSGTLAPGFSVQPNIKAVLRSTLRSDPSTAPNSTPSTVVVGNSVESISTSGSAVLSPVTANNAANISLLSTGAGGAGIGLIGKSWVPDPVTTSKTVDARSNETRSAVIDWGTGSQQFNSVVITDAAADPSLAGVSTSVFDAFDLVSIPTITATMDPLLTYDKVSSVQLYIPGTGWTNTATNPCAGTACDGRFPGYTLTTSESANATGVRLTFIESPTRASRIGTNPNAPAVGSGVAATTTESRSIDLVFRIRDTKRSDSSPVLGTSSTTTYNDSAAGLVLNTAGYQAFDASADLLASGTASDAIAILDQPIDITATKTWTDGPLGVPPVGTPQAFYPTAYLTISGKNLSVGKVNELSIADPTGGDDPFDYVNLTKIESITVPAGADSSQSTVVLTPSSDYPTPYTVAQALALSPTDLANATGITVTHLGSITNGASTTVVLDTQLRATIRGTSDPVLASGVTTMTLQNQTTASIVDPEVLVQTRHDATPTDTTSADATATMDVDSMTYDVTPTKVIAADTTSGGTPAIQYDGNSPNATVTLGGQPTGNVPTTRMVIEDSSPTFWNAYNFNGFSTLTFAAPIDTVEVDVLVGVTYDTSSGITALCNGSTDLTDCWYDGTPSSSTTLAVPADVPSGTTLADIRGVRFTFTKSDYSNWERPHNPLQNVSFSVTRRTTLVAPTGSPVESNLYLNVTPAPGETHVGVFTNTTQVTVAAATSASDTHPVWSKTESATAQIEYQHLPALVKIEKTPAGALPLGSDIPYAIAVTNTGATHDKNLSHVVVVDTIPGDGHHPYLVLPNDPDTGAPETPAQAFSYTMTDGSTVEPAPTVTDSESIDSSGNETITFTLTGTQTIPLGWTLTINTTLDFQPGLAAFTPVTNTATVTSDQAFDSCDSFNSGVEVTPEITDTTTCTTTTTTDPQPSAPLTIVKGVRGDAAGPLDSSGHPILDPSTDPEVPYDDLGVLKTVPSSLTDCSTTNPALQVEGHGFYSYPCVPITRPGGNEEWVSQFTNGGNINLAEIVAIDVLPTQNDTGVIIDSSRGSEWTPKLTSYPAVDGLPATGSYQVLYTASAGVATARCNGADIQNTMGMSATATPELPGHAAGLPALHDRYPLARRHSEPGLERAAGQRHRCRAERRGLREAPRERRCDEVRRLDGQRTRPRRIDRHHLRVADREQHRPARQRPQQRLDRVQLDRGRGDRKRPDAPSVPLRLRAAQGRNRPGHGRNHPAEDRHGSRRCHGQAPDQHHDRHVYVQRRSRADLRQQRQPPQPVHGHAWFAPARAGPSALFGVHRGRGRLSGRDERDGDPVDAADRGGRPLDDAGGLQPASGVRRSGRHEPSSGDPDRDHHQRLRRERLHRHQDHRQRRRRRCEQRSHRLHLADVHGEVHVQQRLGNARDHARDDHVHARQRRIEDLRHGAGGLELHGHRDEHPEGPRARAMSSRRTAPRSHPQRARRRPSRSPRIPAGRPRPTRWHSPTPTPPARSRS